MAKKPRAPEEIIEVPLDQIRPFPGQPRTYFDPEELQKLAESIKLSGQLQPGMVIPVKQIGKDGVRYELVDGERRWRALKLAEKGSMRLILKRNIKDLDQQFCDSLVLNFHRPEHTTLEIAYAAKRLKTMGKKIEDIGKLIGQNKSQVHQLIKLLDLNPKVLKLLSPELPEDQRISGSLCKLLLMVDSQEMQWKLAKRMVDEQMSLLRAKAMVNDVVFSEGKKAGRPPQTGRPARKEFASIASFFDRTLDYVDILASKNDKELFQVIDTRPWEERQKLLSQIDKLRRLLPRFSDIATKTLRAREKKAN